MKLTDLLKQSERETIEAWCRGKTQTSYLGDHTALARVLGTFLMYVDTRDRSLTPHMLLNGYWEMWVTLAIGAYVKPGMRCIDVGANCGYFTLLMAELVGDKGLVAAYEPQFAAYRGLAASVEVNGFQRSVVLSRDAVSDRMHLAFLSSCPTDLGSAVLKGPPYNWPEVAVVRAIMLDQDGFGSSGEPVDFVKIDVQGHEMQVLEGMRETIKKSPKIAIAMEFTPSEHQDPLAALASIQGYGLKIQTIGHDGIVRSVALEDATKPDTGDHRMLWLTRS